MADVFQELLLEKGGLLALTMGVAFLAEIFLLPTTIKVSSQRGARS